MVLTEVQASCRLVSYFGFGTGGMPVPLNQASQSTLFKIAVSSSDPEKCLKRRSFQSCVSSALNENASIYAYKVDRNLRLKFYFYLEENFQTLELPKVFANDTKARIPFHTERSKTHRQDQSSPTVLSQAL
jgi:hypothetical protein